MVFGNTESFAIEAMSEPELKAPSAVWGRMRVWCEGKAIGDYSEAFCALYPAYCGFKNLAQTLPDLWTQELDGLSDLALWNHFDSLLYGYHGDEELQDDRTYEQCRADAERWSRFNFLTNWGEQFDADGKSFITCKPEGVVLILNRSGSPKQLISTRTSVNEVLSAIAQYIDWFRGESDRLGVPADA
jgi:hypothetical protein